MWWDEDVIPLKKARNQLMPDTLKSAFKCWSIKSFIQKI